MTTEELQEIFFFTEILGQELINSVTCPSQPLSSVAPVLRSPGRRRMAKQNGEVGSVPQFCSLIFTLCAFDVITNVSDFPTEARRRKPPDQACTKPPGAPEFHNSKLKTICPSLRPRWQVVISAYPCLKVSVFPATSAVKIISALISVNQRLKNLLRKRF